MVSVIGSAVTASYATNLTVSGTITAQTLVVQTVTSSVSVITGSTNFGSLLTNTHVFSGSVTMNPGGLFVSSSGNVGIGTNSPASSANYTALNINGTTGSEIFLKGANTTYGYMYGNAAAFVIDSNAATPIVFQTNTNERIRITSAGLVRINTTSTLGGGLLGLNGNLEFGGTAGGNYRITNYQAGYLAFDTDNTERMRITSGGEVQIYSRNLSVTKNTSNEIGVWVKGVGTHSSGYASIQSFASDVTYETKLVLQENGGSVLIGTTSIPSAYGKVTIRGTNQGLTIQDAATNGYRSLYLQSGNLYFYNGTNEGYLSSGGTWVNASDVTIKKDVKDIEYGLNEVMQLKPKWYKMIDDGLEQIGFIAQDVEEIIPELVSTSERGMKGLSYGQITAVLAKAIQELKADNDAIRAELAALKS